MDEKRPQRLMGWTLQIAAGLMENRAVGRLLYDKAASQLGLDWLHQVVLPEHAAPYWPRHLVAASVAEEPSDD